ncbi:efflux RND transporter periplasmic adaptor subunit [Luminiphilus syltensis]|uniref:efflux RND transporter periplasmic adaptor subunit n=1 Tax=Luminiphilus syltensis TaxID=1341119 RepID=UPI00031B0278|nr:efflux RND transporter periplasmic adaptor subunit [Luminiphilus syltensis]
MMKWIAVAVVIALVTVGAFFGIGPVKGLLGGSAPMAGGYVPPPVLVSTTNVGREQWAMELESVGRFTAVQGVNVSAESGGIVDEILFAAGEDVTEGVVLLRLNDSVEQANLRSQEAQLRLAKISFEREKQLLEKNSISKTRYDQSEAEYEDAVARVERTRALIEQKQVRAPFSGRVGIREVSIGQYIDPGEPLVTLQALETLYVDFTLPERFFPLLEVGQKVLCEVDAFPNGSITASITGLDAKSSQQTHTVRVRATVEGTHAKLLPDMFANVTVIAGEPEETTVVPQTAISYSLYGNSVFVVNEDPESGGLVVERRYVKLSEAERNDYVAVLEGLEVGEQIVVEGQIKLRSGAAVIVNDAPEQ